MKIKHVIYGILVLLFIGAIVYKAVWSKPDQAAQTSGGSAREALQLDMYVVQSEAFIETLSVTGTVEANEAVLLKSELSGKITDILFEEGMRVVKGTLLVKVYDDDLQAQLTKAEANLALAQDVESRQKQLLAKEAASLQEYNNAVAGLESAQADVALLESQISKTEIRAPFDGVIGFRLVSPGEYMTPGTGIATLVSNNPAKIQFAVPERYSSRVGKNTKIEFSIDGMVGSRKASVYAVEPTINPATRAIQMKALSPNADGALIPGAFVKVDVLMETKKGVMIPAEAIVSESVGQKAYLYKNGKVETVVIETGMRTNDKVEILMGISSGDSLITTGIMQITPRSAVVPARVY